MLRLSFVLALGLILGGCGSNASAPSAAQQTYGAAVDDTDAIPSVAVAAEADVYEGRSLAVDGRIEAVHADGCSLQLDTEEGPPLLVTASRTETHGCAWKVPLGEDGIAAATGPIRDTADTLRLTADGVQVTPVRFVDPDS